MTPDIREDLCPLCGKPNACGAQQSARCWCCDIVIPADLLELVPPESQRKACVCRACVESYRRDPVSFRAARRS